jgi:hypothetical protein
MTDKPLWVPLQHAEEAMEKAAKAHEIYIDELERENAQLKALSNIKEPDELIKLCANVIRWESRCNDTLTNNDALQKAITALREYFFKTTGIDFEVYT